MSKYKLKIKKYQTSGDLHWEYNPLRNIIKKSSTDTTTVLDGFDTSEIQLDTEHPVDIECQPSYDGSVNLILNDDLNAPILVNSGFSVRENNTYERVDRNQNVQTNLYREGQINFETKLQRTTKTWLTIKLDKVSSNGQLAGGNYVFFVKYCDEDYNQTPLVAESGVISIFNGDYTKPATISGTLEQETTDKSIRLFLSDLDITFSKFILGYKRSYSDLNGILKTEYKVLRKPIDIVDNNQTVVITGLEDVDEVTHESVISTQNVYGKVKTQTQVQGMLFFGNVDENVTNHELLQQLSYYIQVYYTNTEVDRALFPGFHNDFSEGAYFNPKNIHDKVGYMPGEMYRLGVVYILNDDSISPVYNLRGCRFSSSMNYNTLEIYKDDLFIDSSQTFIDASCITNTKGVFIMPEQHTIEGNNLMAIALNFDIPKDLVTHLKQNGVKGLMFVRQPRIPIFLAQAYSIGVSKTAYIPMLPKDDKYYTQGVLAISELSNRNLPVLQRTSLNISKDWCNTTGLLCLDAVLSPMLQTLLDGSTFTLKKVGTYRFMDLGQKNFKLNATYEDDNLSANNAITAECVYIPQETSVRTYKNKTFSTKAGSAEDIKSSRNLLWNATEILNGDSRLLDENTIRGNFTPFIGVILENESELDYSSIYNIYTKSYFADNIDKYKQEVEVRANSLSQYMAISDKIAINPDNDLLVDNVYRGDCFTTVSSTKFQSNFLDPYAPLNNEIVKSEDIFNNFTVEEDKIFPTYHNISADQWNELNVSDWNAVKIGYSVSYIHMSNYNLGIRTIDRQHVDEIALYGSPRTFYPNTQYTSTVGYKIPDSVLPNEGLTNMGLILPTFGYEKVPFVKNSFENRIAFSNLNIKNTFANGYRMFTGLSYQDVENQYGAITKLIPYGSDLFCVFEHGCGVVPVNEKALLSTTQGQSIHLYGADVIQPQVTVVSQDYGSTWEDSIVVTPNGIYGVDSWAKKIWRFSGKQFELISDQIVQRYLNEQLTMTQNDTTMYVAVKNIKTHYNAFKGDVMFTFYKDDRVWNLCFNERIGQFTTRYSWTPLLSDNIQNSFISIDRESASVYGLIGKNIAIKKGLRVSSTIDGTSIPNYSYKFAPNTIITKPIELRGYDLTDNKAIDLELQIDNISYADTSGIVHTVSLTDQNYSRSQSDKFVITTFGWGNENAGELIEDKYSNYVQFDGSVHIKFSEFVPWIKLDITVKPFYKEIHASEDDEDDTFTCQYLDSFKQTLCFIADYDDIVKQCESVDETIRNEYLQYKTACEEALQVKIYTHGRAGTYDEIDYSDENPNNNIQPTKWYDKQEPFEFEFVVNTPTGMQKIFDNLVLISNNAEPDSLEISLVGDSYDFNKAGIFKASNTEPIRNEVTGIIDENATKQKQLEREFEFATYSQELSNDNPFVFNTEVKRDPVLNQHYLVVHDKCKDVNDKTYGRRLGNIEYREDKWLVTLSPLYFKRKEKTTDGVKTSDTINSTRLRDKWARVRIKYKGDKLVVISAIQTLMTLSYA